MLGHKAREFKQHQSISLEDLVPDDNFYRQVERSLDLSFVHDLADEFYMIKKRSNIYVLKVNPYRFFLGERQNRF